MPSDVVLTRRSASATRPSVSFQPCGATRDPKSRFNILGARQSAVGDHDAATAGVEKRADDGPRSAARAQDNDVAAVCLPLRNVCSEIGEKAFAVGVCAPELPVAMEYGIDDAKPHGRLVGDVDAAECLLPYAAR